jgi:hypothetical protein
MQPDSFSRFGGGVAETVLHPAVLIAMLLAVVLIFLLPRKYVIIPVISTIMLVPLGQLVLIGGLHFFIYRFLIFALVARMIVTKFTSTEGLFGEHLDKLDLVFTLWAVCRAAATVLLFRESGALVNQCAFLLDAIGGYFMLRCLIRDREDIYRCIRVFACVACLIAISMTYERITGNNPFGWLGGVRDSSEVREGAIRSQGPFQHEILAGVFGAIILPMMFLLWTSGKSKVLSILGALASVAIAITSASSTALLAYFAGFAAICFWPMRRRMRLVRWGFVALIVALQCAMKAPVWFLIQRVGIVGGSSGYHRAKLVDDFIMHFRDWWLIGTNANASWGDNMWDLCNQYVQEGENGGLLTFIFFVALIVICFSRIGKARKAAQLAENKADEWYFWLFGATLFTHMVAYLGISYFDQMRFSWFALIAMISAATAAYVKVPTEEPAKEPVNPVIPPPQPQPAYGPVSTVYAPKQRLWKAVRGF